MGVYLNPGNRGFQTALKSQIYVDMTGLIVYTNKMLGTNRKYICVSRPRRFGKTMAASMLSAYYSEGCDSRQLFEGLEISQDPGFKKHLNKYPVIYINVQDFYNRKYSAAEMLNFLQRNVLKDLISEYRDIDYIDKTDMVSVLKDIYNYNHTPFIFILDEWDCIFREDKEDIFAQKQYLDFLRNLLKDKDYVELAYMTGILPVKKYGTHSALNMFDEYSMTNPGKLARFIGFSESKVKKLCENYRIDFAEMQRWYDGYLFDDGLHIYSPKSVVDAVFFGKFSNYWTKTETYEALKVYIDMNFDGMKDAVIRMLAGNRCQVNPEKFQNDMTTFQSRDDVLTLLVHLGYLAYDEETREVFIPNREVEIEFKNAVEGAGWNKVAKALADSEGYSGCMNDNDRTKEKTDGGYLYSAGSRDDRPVPGK